MIGSSAFLSCAAQPRATHPRLASSGGKVGDGSGDGFFFGHGRKKEMVVLGKVETVTLDVGRDRGGDKVIDRQTGFHAVTNFSGRYIDSARLRQA